MFVMHFFVVCFLLYIYLNIDLKITVNQFKKYLQNCPCALLPVSKTHFCQKRVSSIYARVHIHTCVRAPTCILKGGKRQCKNSLKLFSLLPQRLQDFLTLIFKFMIVFYIAKCYI